PDSEFESEITSIVGKSTDDFSGVRNISLKMLNTKTSSYWSGSNFNSPTDVWIDISTANLKNWSYNIDDAKFTSGVIYKLVPRATDYADNAIVDFTTTTVKYDNTPPDSNVVSPQPQYYSALNLPSLSGTSKDFPINQQVNAGVKEGGVEFKLIDTYGDNDAYWNGENDWSTTTIHWVLTEGTTDWSKEIAAARWTSGHKYLIVPRAEDNINNVEVSLSTVTFYIDSEAPKSEITEPPDPSNCNAITDITGTSEDLPEAAGEIYNSDLAVVKLQIRDTTRGATYWDDTKWISGSAWFDVDPPGDVSPWNYGIDYSTMWTSGHVYELRVKAWDVAGNEESPGAPYTITYDTVPPASAVTKIEGTPTYPKEASVNYVSEILGTSADEGGAGVKKVFVKIKRNKDGWYYNNTASPRDFYVGECWNEADFATWKIFVATDCWTDSGTYIVQSYAIDDINYPLAGDGDANTEIPVSSITFTYDQSIPSSRVVFPGNTDVNYEPDVEGTAFDGLPGILNEVRLRIKRTGDPVAPNDRFWWDNNSKEWKNFEVWSVCASTTGFWSTWVSTGIDWAGQNEFELTSKAYDDAENVEIDTYPFIFKLDMTKPNSVIDVPEDNNYYAALSTVTGTSDDDDGLPPYSRSGMFRVSVQIIKYDPSVSPGTTQYWSNFFEWDDVECWSPAEDLGDWYFDGNGALANKWDDGCRYEVISKAEDIAGNVEVSLSTITFYIDSKEPESQIIIPADDFYGDDKKLELIRGTCVDNPLSADGFFNAGISSGTLRIYDETADVYWDKTANDWTGSSTTWNICNYVVGSSTFEFNMENSKWTNAHTYFLNPIAIDGVNLKETGFSTYTVIFDTVPGTISVEDPVNGSKKNTLTYIWGNASATPAPAALVRIYIMDLTYDTTYWNDSESKWQDSPCEFDVQGTAPWYYDIEYDSNVWTNGHSYIIKAKVKDLADNWSSEVGSNFTYDTAKPFSGISYPIDKSYQSGLTNNEIRGTSTDETGVDKIRILITEDPLSAHGPQSYWDGNEWVGSAPDPLSWPETTLTSPPNGFTEEPWKYIIPSSSFTSGWYYKIESQSYDLAGNAQATPCSIYFTFDTGKPATTIDWPKDGEKYSHPDKGEIVLSSFTGTATDPENTPVVKIEFSLLNKDTTKYYKDGSWTAPPPRKWVSISTATLPDWVVYTVPDLASGDDYELVTRNWDKANNMETSYSTITFIYDEEGPLSEVTIPEDLQLLNALTQIEGTVSDEPAGVQKVELYIHDFISVPEKFWTGVWTETTTVKWIEADTTWKYAMAHNDWVANGDTQYRIRCRGIDTVGNVGVLGSTHTFTFDVTPPVSTFTAPSPDGVHLKVLSSIEGTAYDETAGIDKVYLKITRNSDGYTWKGTSFTSGVDWKLASKSLTPPTTWNYKQLSGPPWVTGSSYTINVQALDKSTNWETGFSTLTFVYDTTPPDTLITAPAGSNLYEPGNINGTAEDAVGSVTKVELRIKRDGSPPKFWNYKYEGETSSWTATNIWFDPETLVGDSWYFNSGAWVWEKDNRYTVESRATDNLGNVETEYGSITFSIDQAKPVSLITKPVHETDPGRYDNLDKITGTSSDPGDYKTDINRTMVMIKDESGWYLQPDKEQFLGSFSSFTVYGTDWTLLELDTDAWTNGETYTVLTVAYDNTGNFEDEGTPKADNAHNFICDRSAPESGISWPYHTGHFSAIDEISGTAQDEFGISDVKLSVYKEPVYGQFWNVNKVPTPGWDGDIGEEDSWFSVDFDVITDTFVVWSSTAVVFDVDYDYRIKVKSYDKNKPNAHEETEGVDTPGSENCIELVYDTTEPDSGITEPLSGMTTNYVSRIKGESSDDSSQVDKVELLIMDVTNPTTEYWIPSGSNWSTTEPGDWPDASAPYDDWVFDPAGLNDDWKSGHTYLVWSKCRDDAETNNYETTYGNNLRHNVFYF
ncbi:MAG: hypothetical protein JRE23_09815, partial [Deltaproteobacteria bacterium]|nr:hypothetical protein [Deltaproteobacteria bacterium]